MSVGQLVIRAENQQGRILMMLYLLKNNAQNRNQVK